MPQDPTHWVGIQPVLTDVNNTVPLPSFHLHSSPVGQYDDPTENADVVVNGEGDFFSCQGIDAYAETVVECRGPAPEDDTQQWEASTAYADGNAGYKDKLGNAIKFSDARDETDFFTIAVDAQGVSSEAEHNRCNTGTGIFGDPDGPPTCHLDPSTYVGSFGLTSPISFTFAVQGTGAPPLAFEGGDFDTTFTALVYRTDDPANWPYQNPDPAHADEGKWFFTPDEVQQFVWHVGGLSLSGRWSYSESLAFRPYKWSYGYGPPQTGQFTCLV